MCWPGGSLVLVLSQDEQLTSSQGQTCAGITITLSLDSNGNINGTSGDGGSPQYVWPTDQMVPSNASYTGTAYSAAGELAWGPNYNLLVPSGATFNVGTWIPNTASAPSLVYSPILETNGSLNGSQALLNLVAGAGVTIVQDGAGDVTISSGGGPAASIPFSTPPVSLNHTSNVTGQNGNNVVNLYFLELPYEITFSHISWFSTTGDNGSDLSDLGIYSVASPAATTATLVANIGATTGIGSSSVNTKSILQGSVTLPAGLYLFVTLSNHGAGFTIDFAIPTQLQYAWSSTSTGSAGVLPSTLTLVSHGLAWCPTQGITNFTSGFPAIGLS